MIKVIAIMIFTLYTFAFVKENIVPPLPPAPAPAPPSDPPVTFHKVVLQWPPTLCQMKDCKQLKRVEVVPAKFKLHGLWPTMADGTSKLNCESEEKWSASKLKDIRNDLLIYWPSYLEPENGFLQHEWTSHGSCSDLELVPYFEKALELARVNSKALLTALSDESIKPDSKKSHRLKVYRKAVESKFKVQPQIICGKIAGSTYLHEIRLCVDTSFNYIDCPKQGWQCCGPNHDWENIQIRFSTMEDGKM